MVKGPQRVISYEFTHTANDPATVVFVSPFSTFLQVVDEIIRWLQLPHIVSAFASIAAFLRSLFTN